MITKVSKVINSANSVHSNARVQRGSNVQGTDVPTRVDSRRETNYS